MLYMDTPKECYIKLKKKKKKYDVILKSHEKWNTSGVHDRYCLLID